MLLVAVDGTVGLTVSGWLLGIACGVATFVALARGLDRFGAGALGPADRVTLVRATLVGAVAALMADAFVRPTAIPALVTLSVVALVLDAVDGWVARRTGTVSPLGAHFDGEVDALLILVLSVYVSNLIGPWVLAIGAARYLFLVAGWLLPWMRAQRYRRVTGGRPLRRSKASRSRSRRRMCYRGEAKRPSGHCARPAYRVVRA